MKRFLKTTLVVLFMGVLLGISLALGHVHTSHTLSEVTGTKNTTITPAVSSSPQKLSTIVRDMDATIDNNGDGISAAATLVDLDTGTEYDAGATTTIYKAASTAKILAAVDYLHEVETGNATLNQTIGGYGTAQQLIKEMIEVSDNTAWSDLNDYLGDQQQSYAMNIGMSSFTGGEYNTMTAADEAKLLVQLADGKLINNTDRALLYSYMANTDSTNLIPAALPSSAIIYHKYGELWGNLHDAAIVSYAGHHFVLVVYTNNSDGTADEYGDQVKLIHAITGAAFKDITAN